jgi:ATP phosphoribosyltransferase
LTSAPIITIALSKGRIYDDTLPLLAQAGLVDEAQRARYAELQALRKSLTSHEGT